MGFIQKVFGFIIRPSHFRTLFVLLILVAAVPLTVLIAQQQQQTQQRASGDDYVVCAQTAQDNSSSCYRLCDDPNDSACTNGCYSTYITDLETCRNTFPMSPDMPTAIPTAAPVPSSGLDCSVSGACTCEQVCNSVPGDPTNCLSFCARVTPISVQDPVPTSPPIPTIIPTNIPIPTAIPTAIPTPTSAPVLPTSVPTRIQTTLPTAIPTIAVASCSLKNKGDANCDDIINLLDYEVWRTELISELKGTATIKLSDFNEDGAITIVDFNIWKSNL